MRVISSKVHKNAKLAKHKPSTIDGFIHTKKKRYDRWLFCNFNRHELFICNSGWENCHIYELWWEHKVNKTFGWVVDIYCHIKLEWGCTLALEVQNQVYNLFITQTKCMNRLFFKVPNFFFFLLNLLIYERQSNTLYLLKNK